MRYRIRTERSIEADTIEAAVEMFWGEVASFDNQIFIVEPPDGPEGYAMIVEGPQDIAIIGEIINTGDN
ncbi:MAG: hypothetical protein ACWGQW_02330 [bacterium]